jgi:hypothetical protein
MPPLQAFMLLVKPLSVLQRAKPSKMYCVISHRSAKHLTIWSPTQELSEYPVGCPIHPQIWLPFQITFSYFIIYYCIALLLHKELFLWLWPCQAPYEYAPCALNRLRHVPHIFHLQAVTNFFQDPQLFALVCFSSVGSTVQPSIHPQSFNDTMLDTFTCFLQNVPS